MLKHRNFAMMLLGATASSAFCNAGAALAQMPGDPVVPPSEAAPAPSPVAAAPTAADVATETGDSSNQLEEIVVTAERRSTSLQDVPIAVTALSAASLNQAKVDTTSQLAQVTPSLVVSGVYENVLKITLRGVGTNDFTQNLNPAVATYIDEVYMGLATGQAQQFFDLERVEILRGPQGTLYGKNATGGAISYYSKQPRTDRVEAGSSVTYGNYDRVEVEGYVNMPLSDTAAVRFSGQIKDRDGFFNNTFRGIKMRAAESKAGRVQLLLKPSESFSATLKLFASEFDGDVPHRQPIGILDPVNLGRFKIPGGVSIVGFAGSQEPHTGETEINTFDDSTNTGGSLHLIYEFSDAATLTSISAYEKNKRGTRDDPDGSRFFLIDNSYFNDSDYISQELRLSGDIGRIDYVVGGHFYREKIDARLDLDLLGCTAVAPFCTFLRVNLPGYPPGERFGGGPARGLPVATNINTAYSQKNRSLAAFADIKFHVSEALTLTGGLRYTTERRAFVSSSTNPLIANPAIGSPLFPGYALFEGKKTWDNLSGRAVVDYSFGDTLVYATYSRGFRAGNWNGLGFTIPTVSEPVNPETLTNYEAGIKSEFLDRRVRLNLAAYYYDYEDLQVSVFVNTTPRLRNAASARIYGGEIEASVLVTDGLTLRFAGGYTNGIYQNFDDGNGVDLSGNVLVNTPKWTGTGGFTYETPLSDTIQLNASTDVRYQGKTYFTPYNFEDLAQDGYVLVNARVGLTFNEHYSVAAWARNLFDEEYNTDGNAQRAPFGMDSIIWGEPRMYGVTVSAKF